MALENACTPNGSIPLSLWAGSKFPKAKSLLPTTVSLLQNWKQTTPLFLQNNDLLLAAPLQALAARTSDIQLDNWLKQGISQVRSLLTPDGIKPFPDLIREYRISLRELFSYLRIKNIIQECGISLREPNLLPPFIHKCMGKLPKTKALSLCYNTLLLQNKLTKPSYMSKWESELGKHFPIEMWHHAQKLTKQASHSLNQWETFCKLTMRWYLVPTKLAHIYPGSDNRCWGCHNCEGSLYHIFWTCTHITTLWRDIHALLHKILGVKVPQTPECFLLHIFPDTLPEETIFFTIHCLMATKTAIAHRWKSPLTPTLPEILGRLDSTHAYERMASRLTSSQSRYKTRWKSWVDYRKGEPHQGL
ncbi:Hypothetical predicted protein [Pelobates cultripes]|uniref:Reverse transcriptase zinc-binding domain-containing protein n=1 Tax=Pelobates cultripes TaxID=61616 RepID=A0AAD1SNH5_PELCU|nr:Hypothetical predicted protein [Pelobates cultripes]